MTAELAGDHPEFAGIRALLIRPDGYIAWATAADDPPPLARWLGHAYLTISDHALPNQRPAQLDHEMPDFVPRAAGSRAEVMVTMGECMGTKSIKAHVSLKSA